ncbi:thiol-disulfide oxidoreductase DCC family protein [Cohnella sp. GCM10027633]|uniref:thiol-disulfide oxidoreductase DCC family protein n=1 Tax=unclassified Cohnella TaxID=2636738 RepID=UPI00362BC6C8
MEIYSAGAQGNDVGRVNGKSKVGAKSHDNASHDITGVIVLIDGDCGMCNKLSQWIIARDAAGTFRFASLQSPVGKRLLREGGLSEEGLSTFVLIEEGRYYTKSTAALRVARKLGGKWRLLYGLRAVPRRLRDAAYDYVARRRYRWFGQADSCPLPTAQLRARFLDSGAQES